MLKLNVGDLIVSTIELPADRVYKVKSISNNGTVKAYTYDGKLIHTSLLDKNLKVVTDYYKEIE